MHSLMHGSSELNPPRSEILSRLFDGEDRGCSRGPGPGGETVREGPTRAARPGCGRTSDFYLKVN